MEPGSRGAILCKVGNLANVASQLRAALSDAWEDMCNHMSFLQRNHVGNDTSVWLHQHSLRGCVPVRVRSP
eukprot:4920290-Amphidinium_carterae.1